MTPRWDWLYFYVEQVRDGLIRLDFDYFFAHDIRWNVEGSDHHVAFIPMENEAMLAVSITADHAFATLHYGRTAAFPLTRGAGVLVPGDLTPQALVSTDDLKAMLRQLGSMEVVCST